jgi:NTP pyrophosphatase (non-canonical NTP hydrolase)
VKPDRECATTHATARRAQIEDELADVATLVLETADRHGIDLAAAIRAKIIRNESRYPFEKARGSNRKCSEL